MPQKKLFHNKIGYLLFSAVGICFAFCQIAGRELAEGGNIVWSPSHTAEILLCSAVLGAILGCAVYGVVRRIPAEIFFGESRAFAKWQAWGEGKTFAVCTGLIVLAWLPYFLSYFPGICAYDAVTQIGQIESGDYVEHHPLAHTLWIRACLFAGKSLFGSANGGAALYTFVQMLLLASAAAYGTALLKRYGVKPGWRLAFLLYAMFCPFHGYLSVSMTKDVMFTAFFFYQVLSLFALVESGGNDLRMRKTDILFLAGSVGMILFRNNGQYALAAMTVFLLFGLLFGKNSRKKLFGRILLECVAALLLGNIALRGLSISVGAVQGDRREMLSMPIQQLARCMLYHGGDGVYPEDDGTMAQEDRELIRELFMEDGYKGYSPHISDPVKSRTLTSVARYQPKRFAATYLRLLGAYPGDFVNAALEVNAGYLYVKDKSHSAIYQEMYPGMEGKGYVQTQWWESVVEKTGVHKDSKWPGLYKILERFADRNGYLKVPVLKYLLAPGIWLWWTLFWFCGLLARKRYGDCLPALLLLAYFGTLILGPVVQLRYVYPVMVSVPYLTLLCLRRAERKTNVETKDQKDQ